MLTSSLQKRLPAVMLCVLTIPITLPFSMARGMAAIPIGKVSTPGFVQVGGRQAPNGTAVFSGEQIAAREAPALVALKEGSSVILNRGAAAMFRRNGNRLLIRAESGNIAFNFLPGEEITIETKNYRFSTSGRTQPGRGELNLTGGRAIMSLSSGSFSALDLRTGVLRAVSQVNRIEEEPIKGNGTLTNRLSTLTDDSQDLSNFAGKCIVISGEAHYIESSSSNRLSLRGTWGLRSGTYSYEIADCNLVSQLGGKFAPGEEPPMSRAEEPGGGAAGPSAGMSTGKKAAIGILVGGGAAGAIAGIAAKGGSKSGS